MSTNVVRPDDQRTRPAFPVLKNVAGVSLILGGVLNGLPQYLVELVTTGRDDFSDQIRWSADHPVLHHTEQLTILVSSLFMPLGLLGLAWVAHHRSPRLAGVAAALVVWGMWGFHNVLAMGYTAGTVAPEAVGIDGAVRVNEALIEDRGVLVTALLPHLVGSFFGLLLLALVCWRAGSFPKAPLLLLVVFLVWDFGLPAAGVFEPHLLLVVSWAWLGVHLLRMPPAEWRGATESDPRGADEAILNR